MHVIGSRFADLRAALSARHAILASVAVPAADVAVRPLGTTRYDEPVEAFVLAGRFPPGAAEAVVRLMREHGGAIISHRTEWKPKAAGSIGTQARRLVDARQWAARARAAARKRPRRPTARLRVRTARIGRLSA